MKFERSVRPNIFMYDGIAYAIFLYEPKELGDSGYDIYEICSREWDVDQDWREIGYDELPKLIYDACLLWVKNKMDLELYEFLNKMLGPM